MAIRLTRAANFLLMFTFKINLLRPPMSAPLLRHARCDILTCQNMSAGLAFYENGVIFLVHMLTAAGIVKVEPAVERRTKWDF